MDGLNQKKKEMRERKLVFRLGFFLYRLSAREVTNADGRNLVKYTAIATQPIARDRIRHFEPHVTLVTRVARVLDLLQFFGGSKRRGSRRFDSCSSCVSHFFYYYFFFVVRGRKEKKNLPKVKKRERTFFFLNTSLFFFFFLFRVASVCTCFTMQNPPPLTLQGLLTLGGSTTPTYGSDNEEEDDDDSIDYDPSATVPVVVAAPAPAPKTTNNFSHIHPSRMAQVMFDAQDKNVPTSAPPPPRNDDAYPPYKNLLSLPPSPPPRNEAYPPYTNLLSSQSPQQQQQQNNVYPPYVASSSSSVTRREDAYAQPYVPRLPLPPPPPAVPAHRNGYPSYAAPYRQPDFENARPPTAAAVATVTAHYVCPGCNKSWTSQSPMALKRASECKGCGAPAVWAIEAVNLGMQRRATQATQIQRVDQWHALSSVSDHLRASAPSAFSAKRR